MNQYEVTAKLWIKVATNWPEEAERFAKTLVDEALIEYMQNRNQPDGEEIRISKAKIIWAKEITQKEEYE